MRIGVHDACEYAPGTSSSNSWINTSIEIQIGSSLILNQKLNKKNKKNLGQIKDRKDKRTKAWTSKKTKKTKKTTLSRSCAKTASLG
ncbi:MAG: hypothetical protein A3E07_02785 [Candidatus Wildermuthbacteria bacterium RIFCSPHIGHO2_12_FULL_45_9]|nr:MAG: hypothetical protein A3E07_02785 [Candidatus Wildermuthbacteria bacterium RIFCSPHIGHO2_12_FULL_45_9]